MHLSVEKYLGFYFLAIRNNATVNIHVWTFMWTLIFLSLGSWFLFNSVALLSLSLVFCVYCPFALISRHLLPLSSFSWFPLRGIKAQPLSWTTRPIKSCSNVSILILNFSGSNRMYRIWLRYILSVAVSMPDYSVFTDSNSAGLLCLIFHIPSYLK